MPMGGLPLPPPSVATKLLPCLEAYDFADLQNATQNFSPDCCLEKGEFGAVYRAWMKDLSSGADVKTEMAVVRFAPNGVQVNQIAEFPSLRNFLQNTTVLARIPLGSNSMFAVRIF